MTALCDRETPACASACSNWGSDSPPSARPPILRKSRRVTPSQNPDRAPTRDREHRLCPLVQETRSRREAAEPPLNNYLTP